MEFDPARIKQYWLNAFENGKEPLPTHIIELSSGSAEIVHVEGPGRIVLIDHDHQRVSVVEEE